MSYEIDDGIALPPPKHNPGPPRPTPRTPLGKALDAMQPGQSVRLPEIRDYRAAEQFAARSRPRKYALRKFDGGWRIWRLE